MLTKHPHYLIDVVASCYLRGTKPDTSSQRPTPSGCPRAINVSVTEPIQFYHTTSPSTPRKATSLPLLLSTPLPWSTCQLPIHYLPVRASMSRACVAHLHQTDSCGVVSCHTRRISSPDGHWIRREARRRALSNSSEIFSKWRINCWRKHPHKTAWSLERDNNLWRENKSKAPHPPCWWDAVHTHVLHTCYWYDTDTSTRGWHVALSLTHTHSTLATCL